MQPAIGGRLSGLSYWPVIPSRISVSVRDWCRSAGAGSAYIEPGSPWQNPHVESFNARLRDELLDVELFQTLDEARVLVEAGASPTTQSTRTRRSACSRRRASPRAGVSRPTARRTPCSARPPGSLRKASEADVTAQPGTDPRLTSRVDRRTGSGHPLRGDPVLGAERAHPWSRRLHFKTTALTDCHQEPNSAPLSGTEKCIS